MDPGLDDAVKVLFRPWAQAPPDFSSADRVLFLGARAVPELALLTPAKVVAVQPFRPWAVALERAGVDVHLTVPATGGHAAALVLPPPQRTAARAMLAAAVLGVSPGAPIVACAPARLGGARLAEDLAELADVEAVDVKARCRVVVARAGTDRGAAHDALAAAAPRPVLDGTFLSQPGVFGWDQVDIGSALLADVLPPTLKGVVVDAGAGWGWLARQLVARSPAVLHLLEADAVALGLAEHNLAGAPVPVVAHWVDATVTWPVSDVDVVVTNPPFHVGGRTDPDVGRAFLERAADALAPSGRLYVVANRHLPYEATLRSRFGRFDVVAEAQGFKVLTAAR